MCDALYDLVPFVQFKKREKHPWESVTFSKVGTIAHSIEFLNVIISYNRFVFSKQNHRLSFSVNFSFKTNNVLLRLWISRLLSRYLKGKL